ncbi:hypothetical protein J6590_046765 [Homalodisca vitripennis]|nr:hypothetical protein J6590_046765 [Homalodisca vitripennis]
MCLNQVTLSQNQLLYKAGHQSADEDCYVAVGLPPVYSGPRYHNIRLVTSPLKPQGPSDSPSSLPRVFDSNKKRALRVSKILTTSGILTVLLETVYQSVIEYTSEM